MKRVRRIALSFRFRLFRLDHLPLLLRQGADFFRRGDGYDKLSSPLPETMHGGFDFLLGIIRTRNIERFAVLAELEFLRAERRIDPLQEHAGMTIIRMRRETERLGVLDGGMDGVGKKL